MIYLFKMSSNNPFLFLTPVSTNNGIKGLRHIQVKYTLTNYSVCYTIMNLLMLRVVYKTIMRSS